MRTAIFITDDVVFHVVVPEHGNPDLEEKSRARAHSLLFPQQVISLAR